MAIKDPPKISALDTFRKSLNLGESLVEIREGKGKWLKSQIFLAISEEKALDFKKSDLITVDAETVLPAVGKYNFLLTPVGDQS